MMSKRNFAAIKSAQETMKELEALAEAATHAPTTAFKTLKEVLAKTQKWNKDFGSCDPAWMPPTPEPSVRQTAMALGAFVQS